MPPRLAVAVAIVVAVSVETGAAGNPKREEPTDAANPAIEELWVEPSDIATRDLFLGPGGERLVPRADVVFRFEKRDTTGHSSGYDVRDPEDHQWDVKTGDEAQSEVAVSRILWAIGYHQPVVYYLETWRMSGAPKAETKPGRFRLESDHEVDDRWSWSENPFVGTAPLRGLLLANLLLNNWDLAASQNRVYRMKKGPGGPARRFVVQDVGGSLGKTRYPLGSRNDLEGFESQDFVLGVDEQGRVKLDYHARHRGLLRDLTTEDVVWTCRLLARLSDRQMRDAFRAAGYRDDETARFVRKIAQKVQEGLALEKVLTGAARNGTSAVESPARTD